jgi:hypothetical protein
MFGPQPSEEFSTMQQGRSVAVIALDDFRHSLGSFESQPCFFILARFGLL